MTARRVLGGGERMEEAVQNCWPVASRNPPSFESEAAFRSWLFRLLIDEAWAVLNQNQSRQARLTQKSKLRRDLVLSSEAVTK
jgi:DNA-directed RNA polymerase specialized sigma24 family protein